MIIPMGKIAQILEVRIKYMTKNETTYKEI